MNPSSHLLVTELALHLVLVASINKNTIFPSNIIWFLFRRLVASVLVASGAETPCSIDILDPTFKFKSSVILVISNKFKSSVILLKIQLYFYGSNKYILVISKMTTMHW